MVFINTTYACREQRKHQQQPALGIGAMAGLACARPIGANARRARAPPGRRSAGCVCAAAHSANAGPLDEISSDRHVAR